MNRGRALWIGLGLLFLVVILLLIGGTIDRLDPWWIWYGMALVLSCSIFAWSVWTRSADPSLYCLVIARLGSSICIIAALICIAVKVFS